MSGYTISKPTKLTPSVVARLVEIYRMGGTMTDAARYAAITRQTLYNWLDNGRSQLDYFATQQEGSYVLPDEAALVILLDGATAEFAKDQLATINRHAAREWTAAAWLLERRLPEEWGKRERVDHTHVMVTEVERIAREKGLDDEATAQLRNFAQERMKRRGA